MAEEEQQQEETKAPPSTVKIVIIAVLAAVLLSGGMAGGAMYFMGVFDAKQDVSADAQGDDEEVVEEKPKGPPQYHSMDPKFVISFRDQHSARFMQFSLQLMTRDNEIMHQLDAHMPAIRSSLLLLFGQQEYADMVTREGKENLLKDVAADVNKTLTMLNDDTPPESGIEAAYFNSFVIQ